MYGYFYIVFVARLNRLQGGTTLYFGYRIPVDSKASVRGMLIADTAPAASLTVSVATFLSRGSTRDQSITIRQALSPPPSPRNFHQRGGNVGHAGGLGQCIPSSVSNGIMLTRYPNDYPFARSPIAIYLFVATEVADPP